MIDGIKVLDLALDTNQLLSRDDLLFPLPVDERTGEVLNQPRRATDQGLSFTLVPRLRPQPGKQPLRCELQGSLHRYHNRGFIMPMSSRWPGCSKR